MWVGLDNRGNFQVVLVNDKGSPNPQGFWRVLGAGVGIFYPPKTPTLVEGMEDIGGYEPDQT